MRRVIVSEFVSLDGVIEDPGGTGESDRGGWAFQTDRGPEGDKFKFDELAAADALLLGRTTYEVFAAAWPSMTDEEGGAEMNGYPKHVVSTTLEEPLEWSNSTLIKVNEFAEEIGNLKEQEGKDIVISASGTLVRSLLRDGLLDELKLMIHPIVVGSGKRLFEEGEGQTKLELVDARTFSTGVLYLTYRPA